LKIKQELQKTSFLQGLLLLNFWLQVLLAIVYGENFLASGSLFLGSLVFLFLVEGISRRNKQIWWAGVAWMGLNLVLLPGFLFQEESFWMASSAVFLSGLTLIFLIIDKSKIFSISD